MEMLTTSNRSDFLGDLGSSISSAGGSSTATGVNMVVSHGTTQVGGDVTGSDGAANTNAVGSTSSSKTFVAPTAVNAGNVTAGIGLAIGLMV